MTHAGVEADKVGVAVVAAGDDFVMESSDVKRQLCELLRAGRARIVLDLRHATYVSGVGLGIVASAVKQARGGGGDVKLVVHRPEVHRVFELSGLGAFLEFYEDAEGACEAFGGCVGGAERALLWKHFDNG